MSDSDWWLVIVTSAVGLVLWFLVLYQPWPKIADWIDLFAIVWVLGWCAGWVGYGVGNVIRHICY